jgi:hypothetical protein
MTTSDPYDYSLTRPGELIAAVPAMLGFVPEKSLVLVTIEHGCLGCAMRADLCDDLLGLAIQMAEVAAASRPERAVLVIVDEAGASCRMCNDEYRELSAAVTEALNERGIELWAAHVVDRIAVGGRWHCADGSGNSGMVDDPSSSPMAAAAVLEGRPLYAHRDELLEFVAVTEPGRAAGLSRLIQLATHAGGDRPAAAARRDVEHAMHAATTIADGGLLSDDDVARLACALTDPRVRDTMYALAVGSAGHEAEALWALMVRVLPDPSRVEALVLLAFSAYSRGDGPLAGISLGEALRANPEHRMARMLDQALQTGMRPQQIRELARTGYRLAKRIGVRLPPPRPFGRRAS